MFVVLCVVVLPCVTVIVACVTFLSMRAMTSAERHGRTRLAEQRQEHAALADEAVQEAAQKLEPPQLSAEERAILRKYYADRESELRLEAMYLHGLGKTKGAVKCERQADEMAPEGEGLGPYGLDSIARAADSFDDAGSVSR